MRSCGAETLLTLLLTFYRIRQIEILRSLACLPKIGGAGGGGWRSTLGQEVSGEARKRGRGGNGLQCSQGRGEARGGVGLARGAQERRRLLAGVCNGVWRLWLTTGRRCSSPQGKTKTWLDAGERGVHVSVIERVRGGRSSPGKFAGGGTDGGGELRSSLPMLWGKRGRMSGTGRCARR